MVKISALVAIAALLPASILLAPGVPAAEDTGIPAKTECATDDPAWVADGIEIMQTAYSGIDERSFSLEVAPEVTDPIGLNPGGFQRLWDMGVAWKDVNPEFGVFDWSVLDARVRQAEAAGAKPMYVLGLTPKWAALNPNAGDPRWGLGTASAPTSTNVWLMYVRAVAERYNGNNGHGKIHAFEVWNEANIVTFWDNGDENSADPFGMGLLAQMTRIAYDEIKAVNPDATVISATTTTRVRGKNDSFGGPQKRYWYYLQALKAQDYPFDAWGIHSYPAGNAGPTERVQDVLCWQEIVVRHFGKQEIDRLQSDGYRASDPLVRPIFDTELNFGLAGPGSIPSAVYTGPISQRLIWRAYIDSVRLGIDSTTWYLYTNAPYTINDVEMGVQMYGDQEAITAYRQVRDTLLRAEDFDYCFPLAPGGSYSATGCRFEENVFGSGFDFGVNDPSMSSFVVFAEDVFTDGTQSLPFNSNFFQPQAPTADLRFNVSSITVSGRPATVYGLSGPDESNLTRVPLKPSIESFVLRYPQDTPKKFRMKATWTHNPKDLKRTILYYDYRLLTCKKDECVEEPGRSGRAFPNLPLEAAFTVPRGTSGLFKFQVKAVNRLGAGPWDTMSFIPDRD